MKLRYLSISNTRLLIVIKYYIYGGSHYGNL
nr:MAG TPA: leucine rich repeat protein [Bacteriophage sp.]